MLKASCIYNSHDSKTPSVYWNPAAHQLLLEDNTVLSGVADEPDEIGEAVCAVPLGLNDILVCDRRYHRLLKFTGSFGQPFGPAINAPFSVAAEGGHIYVCAEPDCRLQSPILVILGGGGEAVGFFYSPAPIAALPSFGLYAAVPDTADDEPPLPKTGNSPLASVAAESGEVLVTYKSGLVCKLPPRQFEQWELPGLSWCPIQTQTADIQTDSGGKAAYTLQTDTGADCFNTADMPSAEPAYQNNLGYSLENTDDHPITVQALIANGRDWSSLGFILQSFCPRKETESEKALSVWDFVRRYLAYGVTWPGMSFKNDGESSATRFLNGFGSGACGSFNGLMALLAAANGIHARTGSFSSGSHAVAELFVSGKARYFDALYGNDYRGKGPKGAFIPDERGETATYDQLCEDHYLTSRAGTFAIGELASLFGYQDRWSSDWNKSYADPCTMAFTLQPGERMEFSTAFRGAFVGQHRPTGNIVSGIKRLKINEDRPQTQQVFRLQAMKRKGRAFICEENGTLRYHAECPYPVTGVLLKGSLQQGLLQAKIITSNGETLLPPCSGKGPILLHLGSRSKALQGKPVYACDFEITVAQAAFELDEISLCFQANRIALCALQAGTNDIKLSATPSSNLKITHSYREITLSPPPEVTLLPKQGNEPFIWQESGAVEAEFMLSERADFAWPVAPIFHQFVSDCLLNVDCSQLLQSGRRYYWRVRAKNQEGVWGKWSQPESFVWSASQPPAELRLLQENRALRLAWNAVEGATTYEIFGSNEKGFTPSRSAYPVWIHRLSTPACQEIHPPNFICQTSDCEFTITGDESSPVRCYYRVCAVDKNGLRSAPTPCVTLPHPFILEQSLKTAAWVGCGYDLYVQYVFSFGQLHYNRLPDKPMYTDYLHRQVLTFSLEGPDWLGVRPHDGYLSGTPKPCHAGINRFLITATDQNGATDTLPFEILVREAE